jgi:hypothetical protein
MAYQTSSLILAGSDVSLVFETEADEMEWDCINIGNEIG